jgi:hypothetical protein
MGRSIAVFDEGELGDVMSLDEIPPSVAPLITSAAKHLIPKTPQKVLAAAPLCSTSPCPESQGLQYPCNYEQQGKHP